MSALTEPAPHAPFDKLFRLDAFVGYDEAGEPLTGYDITHAGNLSRDYLRANSTPGGIDAWCPDCGSPGGCLC